MHMHALVAHKQNGIKLGPGVDAACFRDSVSVPVQQLLLCCTISGLRSSPCSDKLPRR